MEINQCNCTANNKDTKQNKQKQTNKQTKKKYKNNC